MKVARPTPGFTLISHSILIRLSALLFWLGHQMALAATPYPPSPVIAGVQWAPAESIVRAAHDSDNWPLTWADDDALYTTWGDGTGFEPKVEKKLSMGFARITGPPENFLGVNVPSAAVQIGQGRAGKKAWGILSVEGVLYLWIGHADKQGATTQLAWSSDHAKTWTFADWKFAEFGMMGFVNFGKNYAGARDNYVYAYSHDNPKADTPSDRFILLRAPKSKVAQREAWEFFQHLDTTGQPVWTDQIEKRGSVFKNPDACLRSAMTYCAPLRRYLWWQHLPSPPGKPDRGDTRFQGGFAIYDAPEPWGPWTTAFHTEQWDVGPGEHGDFPAKWMSADGSSLFLVFSGEDAFSVRRATITRTPVSAPSGISWSIPTDGGTPRDLNRLVQLGPNEFRINASFEEGGQSVLRHAISRVDLLCQNEGKTPATVTLHLDLSGDGKRTDYDSRPEAGMKLRDFLFIQTPGSDWQQVNGTTERWTATIRFTAPPGATKVGLSPWYTYADYLRFVQSLPGHNHLTRGLLGSSDAGREHWELTVTDPATPPDKKRKIFWHAREHAYETYSSYAMEGLLHFLLSDAAADFRRRYIIVLHPMTNVDGVAQGFEYRGGYDFPDPRGTASGRLTFDAVDRLRPDYAVAWHNWIAPRDRNVVFYTDGENDRPTARAWYRFTQLFPSLRGSDHRWKDEATPLRYNWHGRRPLSEANVHQYAMKQHGTRVWGWEMPWWNCSTVEARNSGALFAKALLTTLDEIDNGAVPPMNELATVTVPRWEMHEFSVSARSQVDNRFRDTALVGEFISPRGTTNIMDGFYDGGDTWRLRFAPSEEGEWKVLLRGEGVEILQRGKLLCTAPQGHGVIRVDARNPYAFAHADGTGFFPMGDTCYGLFDDSPITPALREEYLRARRAQRFNFVRMTVGHSEARAATNNNYWAWGGTAQKPDLDRLNPEFFRRFDDLVRQLRASGMNIELLLLNFYRRPYTDTKNWTPAREQLWLRYLMARYAAFDNIFLWTIANEYETHPDGSYRLDFPGDVAWAKSTARFIKAHDPYRHPVTVHPVVSASRLGESPRSPIDPPWRIGEFFGSDDAMDVISQQTGGSGDGALWDEKLQCWTGDSSNLVASLRADRRFNKPVLNSENGYEYLRGHPTEKKQVHHTDKVRRSAWRIVCAGGYFAAGFHGTIGHSDVWNRIDAPNHYTFVVDGEGAASQLGKLHEFFSALPFGRLQPFLEVTGETVALADATNLYVLYLPHGGATALSVASPHETFRARWFNPREGGFEPAKGTSLGDKLKFEAPDAQDWALLLERQSVTATDSTFRAGAHAVDISPETFPVIVNAMFTERSANKVIDRLYAKALVLDDGAGPLALCVVDTCMLPRDLIDQAKELAFRSTRIPTDRMLVSATHTHSAPSAMGCLGSRADPNYVRDLPPKLAAAISGAAAKLAPARIGWAAVDDWDHTFNRRWIRRPDKMLTDPFGERNVRAHMHPGHQSPDAIGPSGPVDPGLTVMALATLKGEPLAVLANYSQHYYGSPLLSSDYYGRFAEHLAQGLGASTNFVGIMSQGTSGDQMWMDYGAPARDIGYDAYAREIAERVRAVYQRIEWKDVAPLRSAERKLELKYRVPSAERLVWARKITEGLGDKLPSNLPEIYAWEALHLEQHQKTELKLQALQVGDLGIVAIPNEVFALTGLKLKGQSPFKLTMNISLANGAEGYIPPPEQHKLGGYTTWPARTAGLEVEAEPRIVEALLKLLEKVSEKSRRPIVEEHGPYAQAVLKSQPRTYWRLNEMAGSVARDATKNGVTGTFEDGIALYLPGVGSGTGKSPHPALAPSSFSGSQINRAVHFAGGRLRAPLTLGENYSVELWVWNGLPAEARAVTAYLYSRGRDGDRTAAGEHLGIGGTYRADLAGKLIVFNGNERNQLLVGRTNLATRAWHHVVLVREGMHVRVHLNGQVEPEIEGSLEPTVPADEASLFLGGRSDNLFGLEGLLDEAAIYTRPLSAEEIAAHYRASGL